LKIFISICVYIFFVFTFIKIYLCKQRSVIKEIPNNINESLALNKTRF